MQKVITLDELAEEFGVGRRHAARKARVLAEKHGFPRPLPGLINKFSRSLVEAWFARNGEGIRETAPEPIGPLDAVAQARQALEARYVHD